MYFVKLLNEMSEKLQSKTIFIGSNGSNKKKYRVKKPWWNNDLALLSKEMREAEKDWNKCKHVMSNALKAIFVTKRKSFDREVQGAKGNIGLKCKRNCFMILTKISIPFGKRLVELAL